MHKAQISPSVWKVNEDRSNDYKCSLVHDTPQKCRVFWLFILCSSCVDRLKFYKYLRHFAQGMLCCVSAGYEDAAELRADVRWDSFIQELLAYFIISLQVPTLLVPEISKQMTEDNTFIWNWSIPEVSYLNCQFRMNQGQTIAAKIIKDEKKWEPRAEPVVPGWQRVWDGILPPLLPFWTALEVNVPFICKIKKVTVFFSLHQWDVASHLLNIQ